MKIVASSKDKKKVISGKQYIGTGLYKDSSDTVWTLHYTDNNWKIERVASKQYDPGVAKDYWGRIFTSQMVEQLFKRKTVAKKIECNLDSDNVVAVSDWEILDGTSVVKASLIFKKANDGYTVAVRSEDQSVSGKEIKLPSKVAQIIDAFDKEETLNVLSNIVASKEFGSFIMSELYI